MNQAPRNLIALKPLDLATEPEFALGALIIRPPVREVIAQDRRETVEPRVMQVLVALAKADSAVVSRDQLIECCWGGRLVSDDAINSCVAKVRALAGFTSPPAFEIETIPRVGYRLRKREGARTPASTAFPPSVAADSRLPSNPVRWRQAGWIVAAGVVVLAVCAALNFYLQRADEWIVVESHLPFIATPLIERYPAIAPDGTMIAYSAGTTITNRQINLRLVKGGDPIQLTHEVYDAYSPAWSPDSKTIAYLIFQPAHPCRIMEVQVPAGQPHQIGQCRVSERSSLTFDTSGHALFFSDARAPGGPGRLVKLDLENGQVHDVTHLPGDAVSDMQPTSSPGGDALVYVRDFGGFRSQLRIVSLANGGDRLIAKFDDCDVSPAWSSDGRAIFVARSCEGDNALLAYPIGGGAPWRIMSGGNYLGRLSSGGNGLLAIEMGYPFGRLIAVMPHSDLPPKLLDESGGLTTWCVDYASDGTPIATGNRSDAYGVWISEAGGPFRQLIALPDGNAGAIRWSPDGTHFAYIRWLAGGFDAPVLTRSGTPVARIHFAAKESGLLDWTADGKSILTSRQDQQGWRIWRTDLATPDKSVAITPYGWMSPRVHGTMLFAEKAGVTGVWRIDGTPRRVTDGPEPQASDVYTISGDRLIYSDTTDPAHPMFSAQNIYGGPKDRLAPLANGQVNFTFGVDPKSGAIVYSRPADNNTDIGLIRLQRR